MAAGSAVPDLRRARRAVLTAGRGVRAAGREAGIALGVPSSARPTRPGREVSVEICFGLQVAPAAAGSDDPPPPGMAGVRGHVEMTSAPWYWTLLHCPGATLPGCRSPCPGRGPL